MTNRGHRAPGLDEWAVALSLLRFGADTRAARQIKALMRAEPSNSQVMSLLAHGLGIPPAERPRQIAEAYERAASAMARAAKAPITVLPWFHAAYPALLREIADPPIVLWLAGNAACLSGAAVAIVGSRRATPAGITVARSIGRGLAEAGLLVVSGLARGIDAAAHQGALDAGGQTVAILGCGADVVYPPEHGSLAKRIAESGALLTEFPPGTPPMPHHFPLRNRIISGLCRAVLVIEASARSGSLITARSALDQGRDVLAVPGSVASGQYSGCHALIKDGAPLVETVEDVLRELGWASPARSNRDKNDKSHEMSRLEVAMAVGEPYTVDELAARTGLETAGLLAELGALEIAGRVVRVSGAGFVKLDKSAIGEGDG